MEADGTVKYYKRHVPYSICRVHIPVFVSTTPVVIIRSAGRRQARREYNAPGCGPSLWFHETTVKMKQQARRLLGKTQLERRLPF
jgi:hypothetical protein